VQVGWLGLVAGDVKEAASVELAVSVSVAAIFNSVGRVPSAVTAGCGVALSGAGAAPLLQADKKRHPHRIDMKNRDLGCKRIG